MGAEVSGLPSGESANTRVEVVLSTGERLCEAIGGFIQGRSGEPIDKGKEWDWVVTSSSLKETRTVLALRMFVK